MPLIGGPEALALRCFRFAVYYSELCRSNSWRRGARELLHLILHRGIEVERRRRALHIRESGRLGRDTASSYRRRRVGPSWPLPRSRSS